MSTIYGINFIDANIIDEIENNCTDDLETNAVDSIIKLQENQSIILVIPFSVKKELEHENTPRYVKLKSYGFLFSYEVSFDNYDQEKLSKVEKILKGNCINDKHKKDALHIYESSRNSGRYFITKDKRILKKSNKLNKLLSIKVVKPSEFINIYFKEKSLNL